MSASYTGYSFQLVDKRTKRPIDDDSGNFMIYTAGSPSKATCYSDENGTSLTQPGTLTNGWGQFWVAAGTNSVDVTVLTSSGRAYFLEGLTPSQHRIDVDTEKQEYMLTMGWAILSAHADGTISALGFQLQTGMRIKEVFVQKTSAGVGVGSGLVVDFGVSGDPDGFVDGITASSTGYDFIDVVRTSLTTDVAGATDFISLTQNRGRLLASWGAGLLTATTGGAKGYFVPKPYLASLVTTTNNLVFAVNGTSALTTVAGSKGYVFYTYDILPTAGN